MSQATRQSRGLHPIRAAAGVFRTGGWTLNGLDADTVRYAAGVSVWGRWFISVVALFQFAYRFRFWFPNNFEFPLLLVLLVALNGLVHYRLVTGRPVTWRWLLLLSAMDIVLATTGVVFQGGFEAGFVFVAYYPALALFVVVFPSLWLGLAWTTMTAVVYAVAVLTVSPLSTSLRTMERSWWSGWRRCTPWCCASVSSPASNASGDRPRWKGSAGCSRNASSSPRPFTIRPPRPPS